MSKIKLELPHSFTFKTQLAVRIGDINYGNHMSNDCYLKYMQESRLQYFAQFGYSELNLAGASVIMGDVVVVFKQECFYGEELIIEVTATEFGNSSFNLYYRFTKKADSSLVCEAKTGMVCFNYQSRKIMKVPNEFKLLVDSHW
jgi:acyl-CoA thioester hydrolase